MKTKKLVIGDEVIIVLNNIDKRAIWEFARESRRKFLLSAVKDKTIFKVLEPEEEDGICMVTKISDDGTNHGGHGLWEQTRILRKIKRLKNGQVKVL